jgi:hypothetical protein
VPVLSAVCTLWFDSEKLIEMIITKVKELIEAQADACASLGIW